MENTEAFELFIHIPENDGFKLNKDRPQTPKAPRPKTKRKRYDEKMIAIKNIKKYFK